MIYKIAEKFRSVQGEGVYAGTPMAFIRFIGCSVGKKICNFCDTDFDKSYNWRGGGEFTEDELLAWAGNYDHICLTGGEPLDQQLRPLLDLGAARRTFHVETSGTRDIGPLLAHPSSHRIHICVSPKPGFIELAVTKADEVKVIVPGLSNATEHVRQLNTGTGSTTEILHWPTIKDALRWADMGKIVFLQPRNDKFTIDKNNLRIVQDIIAEYPQLRLSVQMHKVLGVQ